MIGERTTGNPSTGTPSGPRGSDDSPSGGAPTTALVLKALRRERSRSEQTRSFLARRARHEVAGLPSGPERTFLRRALEAHLPRESGHPGASGALLGWAGFLESRRRLTEAADVLSLARRLEPDDPELLLHQARVARKGDRPERAARLYRSLRDREGVPPHLARMAGIGAALLGADPEARLSRAIRRALRAGDREAAAVGLEERARLRRRHGDPAGALRDYGAALLRFRDPVDRGRVGHELADLCLAEGSVQAAREVLLEVERFAHPAQAARAASRLFTISLALGDEVGCRRWRDSRASGFVSLAPSPAAVDPSARAADPDESSTRIHRGIRRLRRLVAGSR